MKARLRLIHRTVDGVLCPYPRVVLSVGDRFGALVPVRFRIDTGADRSAIPVGIADAEQIPYRASQAVVVAGLVGTTTKFRGRIRVVIAGEEGDWPCDFINVPAPAAGRMPDPLLHIPLLGRAGFLDDYALSLDSHFLVLTRLTPMRRWWRRQLHAFWNRLGMTHPADEPL